MTKYQKGDRIRVTFPSGTVVEGVVGDVTSLGSVGILELGNYLYEGTPEYDSIELLEGAAPPNGTWVRVVDPDDGSTRFGQVFDKRVYYQVGLSGQAPVPFSNPLRIYAEWEVVA